MKDLKWNFYTCDIEFEYNNYRHKRFKKVDNWESKVISISDFLMWNGVCKVLYHSNEINKAEKHLHNIAKRKENYKVLDEKAHTWSKFNIRNIKACNIRIVDASIKEVFQYHDGNASSEWLKERGLNSIGMN